ncbi:MAG TPA: hypothetical protein VNH64_00105 [Parvularculaceae bacterium]|nr:hypothetical protein [Parvularculaceae bacterium]
MKHSGSCHCGKVKISFETEKAPETLGVRTCQCVFCRRHGALNISDPDGGALIEAQADDLVRYRFALKTSDFLICRHCGVYFAAVIGEKSNIRSTINVAGLAMTAFLDLEEAPMEFGAETTEARIARRFERWTPTRFSDAALSASYFGPHQIGLV